jgi:hypothetical protein
MLTLLLPNLIPIIKNHHFLPDEFNYFPNFFSNIEEDMHIELNHTQDISSFIESLVNLESDSMHSIGNQADEIFEYGLSNYLKENKNILSINIESYNTSLDDSPNTVTINIGYKENVDEQTISVLNYCFLSVCSKFASDKISGVYSTEKFSFEIKQVDGHLSMGLADFVI